MRRAHVAPDARAPCSPAAACSRRTARALLTTLRAPPQIKTGFDEGKELVVTVLKVRAFGSCLPRPRPSLAPETKPHALPRRPWARRPSTP